MCLCLMIWSVEVLVWEFLDFQTSPAVSGSSTRPCVPEARPCVLFSAWDTAVHAARVRLKTQTHARVPEYTRPCAFPNSTRPCMQDTASFEKAATRPCSVIHARVPLDARPCVAPQARVPCQFHENNSRTLHAQGHGRHTTHARAHQITSPCT